MADNTGIECRWNPNEHLEQPLHWRKPRRVRVADDLFADDVGDDLIDQAFAVMALCPQHTFLVLTKWAERMREYITGVKAETIEFNGEKFDFVDRINVLPIEWPLSNVILMTSISTQRDADERLPFLLQTPAAMRGVSVEPMLGPVDLTQLDGGAVSPEYRGIQLDALIGGRQTTTPWHLNWVIAGGEAGPGARPLDEDWVRSLRDQCVAANVSFYYKQIVRDGKKITLPELDGRQWVEVPDAHKN